jgi:hypothetical protein
VEDIDSYVRSVVGIGDLKKRTRLPDFVFARHLFILICLNSGLAKHHEVANYLKLDRTSIIYSRLHYKPPRKYLVLLKEAKHLAANIKNQQEPIPVIVDHFRLYKEYRDKYYTLLEMRVYEPMITEMGEPYKSRAIQAVKLNYEFWKKQQEKGA